MTVQEARERKAKLQEEISVLLDNFSLQTNLCVSSLSISSGPINTGKHFNYGVNAEVRFQ